MIVRIIRAEGSKGGSAGAASLDRRGPRKGFQMFKGLALKLFSKRHYILNFFVRRITSAISEGINNKIKLLKRMAYRDVAYFLLTNSSTLRTSHPRRLQIFN